MMALQFKAISPVLGVIIASVMAATSAPAHPGAEHHPSIMTKPIGGQYNNFWYDYRTDVLEAEHELSHDMRDADDADDRARAFKEYVHELTDAKKDYSKEMAERGYRRGEVIVGSR
jgi:hypothetical protein